MAHRIEILVVSSLALLLWTSNTSAESPRPESPADFFREAHVWDVHLSMSAESYQSMEPEGVGRRRFDTAFTYARAKVTIGGRSFTDVGLRYKGNSSFMAARDILKRSFKIDFNRFVKGQKFLGLTKISLNNSVLDPSQLREAISYSLFRELGLPASRTTFARVSLTVPGRFERRYVGVYTVVEQVNGAFLEDRFGSREGLIIKPERSLRFPYLGEDWKDYEKVWVPKSAVDAAHAARLVKLTRLVERADDETFAKSIGGLVDLQELAKFTALHTVLSHLDSFLLRGHNYYIVLPAGQKTQHLRWIPWDLNSTFAGHRSAGSPDQQMDLSVAHPHAPGNRLLERLLVLEAFRTPYRASVRDLLRTQLLSGTLQKRLDALSKVIEKAARDDEAVDFERFTANFRQAGAKDPDGPDRAATPSAGEPGGRRDPGARNRRDPFGTARKPLLIDFITKRGRSIEAQLSGERNGYRPTSGRRGGRRPGDRPPSRERPRQRPSGE